METKDSVTLDAKCVAAMKPDALSPAETEAKTEGIGVTKAQRAHKLELRRLDAEEHDTTTTAFELFEQKRNWE